MEKSQGCELCRKRATLYCEADSAYLCTECDMKVHGANFLVARHPRNVLCSRCHQHSGKRVRGGSPALPAQSFCGLCNEQTSLCISTAESAIPGRAPVSGECEESRREIDEDLQLCGPVAEVSTAGWSYGEEGATGSCSSHKIPKSLPGAGLANRRRRGDARNAEMKVEAILRKWHGDLNLGSPSTVPLAMHLMEKSLCMAGPVPDAQKVRISLAASLWLAATLCENNSQLPPVKKLQECSGIPCKLIVRSGSRLSRLLNWRRQQEEGWAECSA